MIVNDLRQIEALHHLARTRSFSETARVMNVTPSAISHSIKSLENALKCTLVERSSKPISLTPAGYQFLSDTSNAMKQIEAAVDSASGFVKKNYAESVIRIGIERALSDHILSKLIPHIRPNQKNENQPQFEIATGKTSYLLEELKSGRLDYVAGLTPPPDALLQVPSKSVIHSEELCILLPPNHSSLSTGKVLWEQEKSIVSLSFDRYDRELIESYFYQLQAQVGVHHHVNSQKAFSQLVTSGMGIGIGSKMMMKSEIDQGLISCLPIDQKPLIRHWSLFGLKKQISNEMSALFSSLF